MSSVVTALRGRFGRIGLYRLTRDLATHAHREAHLVFHIGSRKPVVVVESDRYQLDDEVAATINPWQSHAVHLLDDGNRSKADGQGANRPNTEPNIGNEGSSDSSELLTLHVSASWYGAFASSQHALYFGASSIHLNETTRQLVRRFADHLRALPDHATAQDVDDQLLYQLISSCHQLSWPEADAERQPKTLSAAHGVSDQRIRKSLRLMGERLRENPELDQIAGDAGLSRPHFYKLFREHVGVTPNIYLNTLRTERAIERLTTTREPVTSIGLDLGFASQTSFTRFFAANVGIAPSDYRRAASAGITPDDHHSDDPSGEPLGASAPTATQTDATPQTKQISTTEIKTAPAVQLV